MSFNSFLHLNLLTKPLLVEKFGFDSTNLTRFSSILVNLEQDIFT